MPSSSPQHLWKKQELENFLDDFLRKSKTPLLCISGPTASGKTALSIELCKKYNGEVINADSRQFYKGCDIGTAKITKEEMEGVQHHFLSFLEPEEECNIAQFKIIAEEKILEILENGKIPFVVGGSGLFVDSLRKNFIIPKVPPNQKLRDELERKSAEEISTALREIDPEVCDLIPPNNIPRLIRALEVCFTTGKKFSELQETGEKKYDDLVLGIWVEPLQLQDTIKKRTREIWESGFLEEIQQLIDQGYDENTPAMTSHGYREAMEYLNGKKSKEEAMWLMERNTRRYAKRQRTWWRREKEMVWIEI